MSQRSILARLAAVLFFFAAVPAATLAADVSKSEHKLPAEPIAEFRLQNAAGGWHALSDFEGKPLVVAFLGTECPLAKLYGERLQNIADRYDERVQVVGVMSNSQDSMTEVAAYVRRHKIGFPVLKDPGNKVADQFQAERTPEVFLLDGSARIRYRGRVDDQYGVGYTRDAPKTHDLQNAIDELLADKPISQPITEVVGCFIGKVREADENAKVTYSSHIAALMNKHCVECHRDGEIAPFTLTNYEDVSAWAETIAEVVADQRMPPWHANPKHGDFSNARLMTTEEKQALYDWVDSGAPHGDPSATPPLREFVKTQWRLGQEPDQVVPMRNRPYQVASQGTIEYQYFVADPKFKEDKWIKAAEIIPGNRSVVHHAIVFVRPPEGFAQRGVGWLTAYVPGQALLKFDNDGLARRIPAGSKFIFQMHYTAAGSPQQDITKVGLVFAEPETVKEEVITLIAIDRNFEIPPHAKKFPVEATLKSAPANGRLLAVAPHMHVRGRSFRVEMSRGGGPKQTLLDVPHYDFNWQHSYNLRQPIPLRDLKLECRAEFDNSEDNLVNPDPTITVRWGDQTWEEMMIAFFEVAVPVGTLPKSTERPLTSAQRRNAQAMVEMLFERWDEDSNNEIDKREMQTANAFNVFAFNRLDKDRNGKITRDEATRYAEEKQRKQNARP